MNGNEEICVVPVRYVGTLSQCDVFVCGAGHDHLYGRIRCLDFLRKTLCNVQGNLAFICLFVLADTARVGSAVACINAYCIEPQFVA